MARDSPVATASPPLDVRRGIADSGAEGCSVGSADTAKAVQERQKFPGIIQSTQPFQRRRPAMSRRTVARFVFAAALALANAPAALLAQAPASVTALPPAWVPPPPPTFTADRVVAVRAGRLFDPRSGTFLTNQIVLIRGERIAEVGPNV